MIDDGQQLPRDTYTQKHHLISRLSKFPTQQANNAPTCQELLCLFTTLMHDANARR